MMGLRKRRSAPVQEAILHYLDAYKSDPKNDGNNPTYQEIADALGKQPSHVYDACMKLVVRGDLQLNDRGKLIFPDGQWRRKNSEDSAFE